MSNNKPSIPIADFLKHAKENADLRRIFALNVIRSTAEWLYLEHWRSGVVRRIPAKSVKSVTPTGSYLNGDLSRPLVEICPNPEADFTETTLAGLFGDPQPRSVTLIPFVSPPGGTVQGAPVVEFFAQAASDVNCHFSPLQPEPPYRPIERCAAIYKNDYFSYYKLFSFFTEQSPNARIDFDSYDYYWAMAFFTRPQASTRNWRSSVVSAINVLEDRFTFTFVDIVFQGGTTGGEIKIESKVDIIFDQ
jgi:hypothetical protein